MHHRSYIRTHSVDRGVHGDLAGSLLLALDFVPLHIHDDQIVDMHHSLAYSGRSRQNAPLIQPDRDITVVGGHPTFLENKPANIDDVLPIFLFRLRH